jgi:hypothetical protein
LNFLQDNLLKVGIVGVMRLINSTKGAKMEDKSPEIDYDKVDPELILIKLKEVLEFIRKLKREGKI